MTNMHNSPDKHQQLINNMGGGAAFLGGCVGSILGPGGTVVGAKVGYLAGAFLGAVLAFNYVKNQKQH